MAGATSLLAGSLSAEAVNGIGSGDPLMTQVSSLSAINSAANHIQIDNIGAVAVSDLKNLGTGDVIFQNIGAITTGDSTVSSLGGSVSLTAHSPLTIGTGGVSASGSISLEAAASGGSDNLTINGNIASANGSILLSAGSAIVLGPGGILSAPNGTIMLTDSMHSPNSNSAATANQAATDNTVSSLITTMGKAEPTVKDDDDERKKKTTEGGEQTTNDKKMDDNSKKYCN
jgi:hypothetical protein